MKTKPTRSDIKVNTENRYDRNDRIFISLSLFNFPTRAKAPISNYINGFFKVLIREDFAQHSETIFKTRVVTEISSNF